MSGRRTAETLFENLKKLSKETNIDFGVDKYKNVDEFKKRYFTGPGNVAILYDKINKISDETNLDFGQGTRAEWLKSFGFGSDGKNYNLVPRTATAPKAQSKPTTATASTSTPKAQMQSGRTTTQSKDLHSSIKGNAAASGGALGGAVLPPTTNGYAPKGLPEGFGASVDTRNMPLNGMELHDREMKRMREIRLKEAAARGDRQAKAQLQRDAQAQEIFDEEFGKKKMDMTPKKGVMAQLSDRLEYELATGERLSDRDQLKLGLQMDGAGNVLQSPLFAPVVARDEDSNMIMGEDGKPLIDWSTDIERRGAYGQTIKDQNVLDKKKYLLERKAEVEKKMAKIGEEAEQDYWSGWTKAFRGNADVSMYRNAVNNNGRMYNDEYRQLQAQLDEINKSLDVLKEAKAFNEDNEWVDDSSSQLERDVKNLATFFKGVGRGFADKASKVSTWDFGLHDLQSNAEILRAALKVERDGFDKLTKQERDLLNMVAFGNAVSAENADNIGRGYKAGATTAESLPMMIEMILNPASGIGKSAAAKVMREAIKRYGKDAVRKQIKKFAKRKILTRGIGDLAASVIMAGTTGQGMVLADTLNRMMGTAKFTLNDKGEIVYDGREDQEANALVAYAKSFTAKTWENNSEMVGEYFTPFFNIIGKGLAKGADKIGLGFANRLINNINKSNWAKAVKHFESKTKWSGAGGEFLEEIVGGIENALTVGDQTLDTDKDTGLFNKDNLIDTAYGVGIMSLLFSAAKTAGYKTAKREAYDEMVRQGKSIDRMFNGNTDTMAVWEQWRNTFMFGEEQDRVQLMRDILDDKDLSRKVKAAMFRYSMAVNNYRAAANLEEKIEGQDANGNTAKPNDPNDPNISNDTDDNSGEVEPMSEEEATEGEVYPEVGGVVEIGGETESGREIEEHYMPDIADPKQGDEFALTDKDGNERHVTIGQRMRYEDGEYVADEDGLWIEVMVEGEESPRKVSEDELQSMLNEATPVEEVNVNGEWVKASEVGGEQQGGVVPDMGTEPVADNDVVQQGEQKFTHESDGKVHKARLVGGGEQGVFITKGNIVTRPDGSIDTDKSDEAIYYIGEDGKPHAISPDMVASVEEPVDVAETEQGGVVPQEGTEPVAPIGEDGKPHAGMEQAGAETEGAAPIAPQGRQVEQGAQLTTPANEGGATPVVGAERGNETSALSRIPKREDGEYDYESVDADTAWDGIVEQCEGDEETAQSVVASMVADKEAELKRLQNSKLKLGGKTVTEKIAAEKERKAAVAQAQAAVEHWKGMQGVVAARAEAQRKAEEEARRQAQEETNGQATTENNVITTTENNVITETGNNKTAESVNNNIEGNDRSGETEMGEGLQGDRQNDRPEQGQDSGEVRETGSEENAAEGENAEPKPIGYGVFGAIYDQFKGKVREAFEFLTKRKSGDLLGVFHREGFGDIDLVWGSDAESKGLDHIINKHIIEHSDFSSVEDAMLKIDDIIKNGAINEKRSKWDKVVFEKDGYFVVVRKNVRDNNGNIIDDKKNWVVTAFDNSQSEKAKKKNTSSDVTRATPNTDEGGRAVTPDDNSSAGKVSDNSESAKGKGEKNDVREQKAEVGVRPLSKAAIALRDALADVFRKAGGKINVSTEEGQKVLDAITLAGLSVAQKRALKTYALSAEYVKETAPRQSAKQKGNGTVVSNDNAKVMEILDNLVGHYEKSSNYAKGFITDVARALSMKRMGSSNYRTFELPDGRLLTIRMSKHNASVKNFDDNGEMEGISIVVSPHPNRGLNKNGKAHVVEFFYSKQDIENVRDGKPLVEIVKSLKDALQTGEYKDNTGLAKPEDVNNRTVVKFQRVYHGSGADFDEFDFSFMGTGEGAQAYGWGAYVSQVFGIGKGYAEAVGGYSDYDREEAEEEMAHRILESIDSLGADLYITYDGDGGFHQFEIPDNKYNLEIFRDYYRKHPDEFLGGVYDDVDDYDFDDSKDRKDFAYDLIDILREDAMSIAREYDYLWEGDGEPILYTVEIPDDNGSNYLSYNEAVGQQISKKVKDSLYEHIIKNDDEGMYDSAQAKNELKEELSDIDGETTGEDLYGTVASYLEGQKEASEFLHSIGFTGIKYPAQYRSGGRADGALNYVIFNENDLKITDKMRFFKTKDGRAYGFVVGGKMYIDWSIADAETVVHEYTHLWAEAYKAENPKGWKNIVKLMKKSGLWEQVMKDYPELKTDDEIADEVLAQYSGKRGAEKLRAEMDKVLKSDAHVVEKAAALTAIKNVKEALDAFWRGVANLFGYHFKSAEEVADAPLRDLLSGVVPEVSGKSEKARYQFIGEKGAAAIDKAEEATIRLDNLSVAREMESAGKDAKAIKMATGWERGKDGKWRYETGDGEFSPIGNLHPERFKLSVEEQKELDANFDELMTAFEKGSVAYQGEITEDTDIVDTYVAGGMERAKAKRLAMLEDKQRGREQKEKYLDDYLDNEELFAAYPELRDVIVKEGDGDAASAGYLGYYNPLTKSITLSDGSQSTLLHEVQHAIQYIEGFAHGGNIKSVRNVIKNTLNDMDYGWAEETQRRFAHLIGDRYSLDLAKHLFKRPSYWMKTTEHYKYDGGGALSRKQQIEKGKEYARDAYYLGMDRLFTEAEQRGIDLNNFGINEVEWRKRVNNIPLEYLAKEGGLYIDEAIKAYNAIIKSEANGSKQAKAILDLSDKLEKALRSKTNTELYQDLAGEVEARNVEKRMNMSLEERRASLASETEDVAREDQIVLMDGLGVSGKSDVKEQRAARAEGELSQLREKEISNVIIDKEKTPKSRKEAREFVASMSQPFTNKDQGVEIYVSGADVKHTSGFRNEDQYKLFGGIEEIIGNAVKIGEEPKRDYDTADVKSISIYYCPINIEGRQYSGRLVVKEYVQGTHGLDEIHLYNVMLRKERGATAQRPFSEKSDTPSHPVTPISAYKVKDLIHSTQANDKKMLGMSEEDNTLFREGDGNPATRSQGTKREWSKARQRASEWSERLGVDVVVCNGIEDVESSQARAAIEEGRSVTGWYDKKTGKVYLYMPNIASMDEVDRTFVHEVVAHKGIRSLLGREKYGKFLDDVWQMMSEDERKRYMSYPGVKSERDAADEYVARLSESTDLNGKEKGIFRKIVDYISDLFRRLGLRGLTKTDIEDVIRKSYANLKANSFRIGGNSVETEALNAKQSKGAAQVMEDDGSLFRVSKNTRKTIENWLGKRDDLSEKEINAFWNYIENEEPKKQLAMGKWFGNGAIRLPEDQPTVDDAMKHADKMKVDPLSYAAPAMISNEYRERFGGEEKKSQEDLLSPDDAQFKGLLTKKTDYGNGIVVYNVRNNAKGQDAVRALMNDHLGKDFNCWCLAYANAQGEITDSARGYWKNYDTVQKRVAFKDGRICAFCASDNGYNEWWDLSDRSHSGIPVESDLPNDSYGRKTLGEYDEKSKTMERSYGAVIYRGNKKNGRYEEWYDEDPHSLKERANYKGGKKEGLEEAWYEDGQLYSRVHYKGDKENGLLEWWHRNGRIWSRSNYKNGEYEGLHEIWNERGQLIIRANFKDGKKDGLWEEWHSDGQLKERANYKNGELEGLREEWYNNGQLKERANYKDGKLDGLYEEWYDNGQLYRRANYKDDKLEGLWEIWFDNGQLYSRVHQKDGKEDGLCETWYRDGQLSRRLNYKDGKLDGLYEEWYDNGQLQERCTYKDGKKEGLWEKWNEDGLLIWRANFKNGRFDRDLTDESAYQKWLKENGKEDEGLLFREGERIRSEREMTKYVVDKAIAFTTGRSIKEVRSKRLLSEQKRRDDAKEIYSKVLNDDINDVSLQQINDYINESTFYNRYGRPLSERIPQRVERALHGREQTNRVDVLYSRICEGAVRPNERFSPSGRREIEERKKKALEVWAKASGNWHTDLLDFTDNKEPIGRGTDSDVYLSKDGKSVIKLSKGKPYGKRFRPDIDNVAIFNSLFKNSAYDIIGYGDFGGGFVRVLKQRFVDFKKSTPLSKQERIDYMGKMGFAPMNDEATAFTNGEIIVSDLQKANIIKDEAGNIRVIDADCKLHTKDIGGNYTYPPVEFDTRSVQRTDDNTSSGNVENNVLREGENATAQEGKGDVKTDSNSYRVNQEWNKAKRRAAEWVKKLNLSGRAEVYDSIDDVPGSETFSARQRKAKGWFDPKTGKLVIVLGNNASAADVVKTVLHEAVGHYGLRELFGEGFDEFLDKVYENGTESVREKIDALARDKYKGNTRKATEEYLSSMAEDGGFDGGTMWQKIKRAFIHLLHKMGLRDFNTVTFSDNELRYVLWRSHENLKDKNGKRDFVATAKDMAMQHELGVGNYAETESETMVKPEGSERKAGTENEGALFRDGDGTIGEYNRAVNTGTKGSKLRATTFNFREAFQDSMLAVRKLQDVIMKKYGLKSLRDSENPWQAENALSSKNMAETKRWKETFYEPMMRAADKLLEKLGNTIELNRYLIARHGLERNIVLAKRDAQKAFADYQKKNPNGTLTLQDFVDQFRKKDYSGLSSLMDNDPAVKTLQDHIKSLEEQLADEKDKQVRDQIGKQIAKERVQLLTLAEQAALDYISDVESNNRQECNDLWAKINKATESNLKKAYDSGIMSKELYEHIKGMFSFYVPLRGFSEDSAEDLYDYINAEHGTFNGVMVQAGGRGSVADDPLATIGNMADSAILQGNRNKMKQKLLNLVMNHPTEVCQVKDVWLVRNASGEWVADFPQIPEDATPDEIAQIIADHEQDMKLLEQTGDAQRFTNNLDVDHRIDKKHVPQHAIVVMVNGERKVVYVNGNPRAAQAMNGQTGESKEQNEIMNFFFGKVKRWYSSAITSLNPNFSFANFARDMPHALAMAYIKGGVKGGWRYAIRIPKAVNGVLRAQTGLKGNSKIDRYYEEFLMNGGVTGYAHINDVERWKADNSKRWSRLNALQKTYVTPVKGLKAIIEAINWTSETLELIPRFAAYLTARESGAEIGSAVREAKNITVNFNKKGSEQTPGIWGAIANILRMEKMFFNPIVQGLNQFYEVGKANKGKMATVVGLNVALGAALPIINELLVDALCGDDDDEKDKYDYWKLSEYTRRNNLCLFTGSGYIKIPIAPGFREVFGIGEIATTAMLGRADAEQTTMDIIDKVRTACSIEGQSQYDDWSVSRFLCPEHFYPILDVEKNENFMGNTIWYESPFNEYQPEYQKAKESTWKPLVKASKAINEAYGGDEDIKADLPFYLSDKAINPAAQQHLITNFGGGFTQMVGDVIQIINDKKDGNEIDIRNIPIGKRFYEQPTDKSVNFSYYRDYKDYKDMYDKVSKKHSALKGRVKRKEITLDQADKLEAEYMQKHPEEAAVYKAWNGGHKKADITKRLKKLRDEDEEEYWALIKDAVEAADKAKKKTK